MLLRHIVFISYEKYVIGTVYKGELSHNTKMLLMLLLQTIVDAPNTNTWIALIRFLIEMNLFSIRGRRCMICGVMKFGFQPCHRRTCTLHIHAYIVHIVHTCM